MVETVELVSKDGAHAPWESDQTTDGRILLPNGGDPRFMQILGEMASLHCRKACDYGSAKRKDPLANLRASSAFGIEPWVATLLRENDKTTRLQSFIENGTLACEGVEDSLLDKACYSILALILFREATASRDTKRIDTLLDRKE